jgi:hypothetical protein
VAARAVTVGSVAFSASLGSTAEPAARPPM